MVSFLGYLDTLPQLQILLNKCRPDILYYQETNLKPEQIMKVTFIR